MQKLGLSTKEPYTIMNCLSCVVVGINVGAWFPPGLEIRENVEKWEGIFQSGKSQGILSRLEKSGNFAQNTGKTGKFE